MEKRTGLRAKVGPVQLHRGRVVLHDVTLTQPDGTRLLTVPQVTVILHGAGLPLTASAFADIAEIELQNPEARLVREKSGRFEVSRYWPRPGKGAPFRGRVTVRNGTVTFVDETRGGLTTTVQKIAMTYAAVAKSGGNFTVTGQESKGAWSALTIWGENDPSVHTIRLRGEIRGLSLVRAPGWIALPSGLSLTSGRADVDGELTLVQDTRRGIPESSLTFAFYPITRRFSFPGCAGPSPERAARCASREGKFASAKCPACCSAFPSQPQARLP